MRHKLNNAKVNLIGNSPSHAIHFIKCTCTYFINCYVYSPSPVYVPDYFRKLFHYLTALAYFPIFPTKMNNVTFAPASMIEYDQIQNATFYLLYSLELLLHSAELPISTLNFYIIFTSAVIHPNLKFILLCQSFTIFQRSLGRVLVDCVKFLRQEMVWDGSDLLQYIYRSAIFFCNFLGHILVLERGMATIFVKNYEHRPKRWFSAAWFCIVLAISIYNLYSRSSVEQNPQEFVTSTANLLTTMGILSLTLAEICLLCWLCFYNRQTYFAKFDLPGHSLTERYQLSENIRTGRQLIPVFCFHFMNLIATSIIQSAFYYRPFQSKFAYDLITSLVVLWGTVNNLGIEICMIIFHPFLARRLGQMWKNLFDKNKVVDVEVSGQNFVAIDLNGAKLMHSNGEGEEMETYFSILNKAWRK